MKIPLRVSGDVTLREATPADKEFAYRVKKAAFKEYVEQVWGWEEADQRKLHDRRFRAEDFTVIALNNVDIGTMYVTLEPDCVQVHQIYILPEHQGRGVGRTCMGMVMDWARGLGLPVRLRVLKVNPRAGELYERLAFSVTSETETHLLMERSGEGPPEPRHSVA